MLVPLSSSLFAELLHRSEEVMAVVVFFKIEASTLRPTPLRALDELSLPGNVIAEAARGTAAFVTSAHEDPL